MVRAALGGQGRFDRRAVTGAAYIPAASVILASALNVLPIVSVTGWWPNFGFLMLIAWRCFAPITWPACGSAVGIRQRLADRRSIGLSGPVVVSCSEWNWSIAARVARLLGDGDRTG